MKPVCQVVFDGQSHNFLPSTGPFPALAMAGRPFPWSMVGLGSTSYAQREPSVSTRVDSLLLNAQTSLLVVTAGSDEIMAGMSAATLMAATEAYVAARRAAGFGPVIVSTVPPGVPMTAGQHSARAAYNTLVRAGSWRVLDLAAIPSLASAADLTFYNADGLHLTAAGAALAAQALGVLLDELLPG